MFTPVVGGVGNYGVEFTPGIVAQPAAPVINDDVHLGIGQDRVYLVIAWDDPFAVGGIDLDSGDVLDMRVVGKDLCPCAPG